MNNYSALMYNVQNLYGSIAGINSKIYELENYILKPKIEDGGDVAFGMLNNNIESLRTQIAQLETQMNGLQSEFDTKMNIINTMKDQMSQLESDITHLTKTTNGLSPSSAPPAPPSIETLETLETPETQPAPTAPPEEVFELVPPKPKGGRRRRS